MPKRISGTDGDFNWFDFRPQSWDDPVRIRWPARDDIAVIAQGYAVLMFNLGYGSTITQAHADAWNLRIEEGGDPALDPDAAPANTDAQGQQLGAAATTTPPLGGEPTSEAARLAQTAPGMLLGTAALAPEAIADAADKASPEPDPERTEESQVPPEPQQEETSGEDENSTEEAATEADEADAEQTEEEVVEAKKSAKGTTKKRTLS